MSKLASELIESWNMGVQETPSGNPCYLTVRTIRQEKTGEKIVALLTEVVELLSAWNMGNETTPSGSPCYLTTRTIRQEKGQEHTDAALAELREHFEALLEKLSGLGAQ